MRQVEVGTCTKHLTVKLLHPNLQSVLVQVVSGWPWFFSMYSRRPLQVPDASEFVCSLCLLVEKHAVVATYTSSPPYFGDPKFAKDTEKPLRCFAAAVAGSLILRPPCSMTKRARAGDRQKRVTATAQI